MSRRLIIGVKRVHSKSGSGASVEIQFLTLFLLVSRVIITNLPLFLNLSPLGVACHVELGRIILTHFIICIQGGSIIKMVIESENGCL